MIKWFERNRFFSFILVILIAAEIFLFSTITGVPSPGASLKISPIYHFSVFFLLNFFLLISLNGDKKIKPKYFVMSLVFSIVYSLLDEIHQFFVPFRNPDLKDVLTNNIGIFLSAFLYYIQKIRR